jgi:hypothetical protein
MKKKALTHALNLPPIPLARIPNYRIMSIATRHLACLARQTIEIGPNELGRFSKEVANGLRVCTAIDIPAELLMASHMNGWDDDNKGKQKVQEIGEVLNKSPVEIHEPDAHGVVAESLRQRFVLWVASHPQRSSHTVVNATVSET